MTLTPKTRTLTLTTIQGMKGPTKLLTVISIAMLSNGDLSSSDSSDRDGAQLLTAGSSDDNISKEEEPAAQTNK